MDLHQVEAGRLRPLGRLAESLHDLLDLLDGHGHRDGTAGRSDLRPGDVGGGLGLLKDEPLPARMGDLDGRHRPVRPDRVRDERQPGNVFHPGDAQLAGRCLAGVVVYPGVLDDDHGRAALGHFLVVAEHPVGDGTVGIGESCVLRGLDDPVLERDSADPARLEQTGETRLHQYTPSLTHI